MALLCGPWGHFCLHWGPVAILTSEGIPMLGMIKIESISFNNSFVDIIYIINHHNRWLFIKLGEAIYSSKSMFLESLRKSEFSP